MKLKTIYWITLISANLCIVIGTSILITESLKIALGVLLLSLGIGVSLCMPNRAPRD